MKTRRALAASPLLLVAAALTACVEHNRRTTLGDEVELATISGDLAPIESAPDANVLDRSDWTNTRIVVPVDGTAARYTWRTHPTSGTDETPRQRGEFPTALSAVNTDEPHAEAQYGEAARTALTTTADTLWLPIAIFVDPAYHEVYSPIESYDRSPWADQPPLPISGRPTALGLPATPPVTTSPMPTTTPPSTTTTLSPPTSADGLPPAPAPRPKQAVPPRPNLPQ